MSTPMPAQGVGGGEARTEKLKTNLSVEEARQVALPVTDTPGLSVDKAAAQNLAIGNESFNGQVGEPKGLTTTRLFATPAKNDDERFERLEAAMQKMRDDFDAVNPSINRLISIEREIQTLVDQLQVLVENDAAPAPVPPVSAAMLEDPVSAEFPADENAAANSPPIPLAPPPPPSSPVPETAPATAPTPAPAPKPISAASSAAPSASGATLVGVRASDNPKTTRIVFDATENIPYTADVDPEKILIVTFGKGTAASTITATKLNSKLVKSIDQTPQSTGGFIIAMPLSGATKIVTQGVLKPDANNPNYRIYIDLAR